MKPKIVVCMGSSCFSRGNEENLQVIEDFLEARGLRDEADLELSCCLCTNRCSQGPIVMIDGTVYTGMNKGKMFEILRDLFNNQKQESL
ncbi:MAG: (2Fe-2S) ferredoxin domain-containing protein [Spirochaetia bacterium]|nr:(2Fe-2S) ferredoxin domain-containing protein [Spirochaetia bacterium]